MSRITKASERKIRLTIIPICRRELTVSARRGRLQLERAWFAVILLVIALGTFASWYFSSGRFVGRYLMSQVAAQTFLFVVVAHAMSLMGIASVGALSIAGEMDRKTLGFLLATRLGNAEIVLGKLAACLAGFFTSLAAGLPVMILLSVLGGVSRSLILLTYAAIVSTAFLVVTLAIWVSSAAPDGRRAMSAAVLWIMAWLIVPFIVGMTPLLTRLGIRPPSFVLSLNAWALASNPLSLLPLFIGGGVNSSALYYRIGWMSGLQLAGGMVLLLAAIVRLRRAFRTNAGGDGGPFSRQMVRPAWRFRPRPPVSDKPILWREMYTTRGGVVAKIFGYVIVIGCYAALGYFTFFFASRALVELWHHGYTAVSPSSGKPELNLVLRFFMEQSGPGIPIDAARIDFNLFLRLISAPLMFVLMLITSGTAVETLASERSKGTWSSLIMTPLTARDILRGKLLASIWRLRGIGITFLSLWTLGLISGAVHPIGYVAIILTLLSSTAFYLVVGQQVALQVEDQATASGRIMLVVVFPILSGLLPFFAPAAIGSIAWGVASTPLVSCLAFVSYREVSCAWQRAVYPPLEWVGLNSGDGCLVVILTCVIGIVGPALGARWIWNYCMANFDRLVGRPTREEQKATVPRLLAVPATAT
jgi:ABC-type transport system involved in multi-copper enzyme maturation permease subunit